MSDTTQSQADALLARWEHDCACFAREVFGITLYDQQIAVTESVDRGRTPMTVVRSGQKTGKSKVAAIIAWWWGLTRRNAEVFLTGPSAQSVRDILWKEFRRCATAAADRGIKLISGKIPETPHTGVELPGGQRIVGFTTDDATGISGRSGKNLLVIIDEASGFPEEYWAPWIGNLAGGGKLLALSNPTKPNGQYYDAFHSQKAEFNCHHLRSDRTPNVIEGTEVIEGLAGQAWVERQRRLYGESHPIYQIRVLGEFPQQGSHNLIALTTVYAAQQRWPQMVPGRGRLTIGADIARYGDDSTVITGVRDQRQLPPAKHTKLGAVETADAILDYAREHRLVGEIPTINIDENGPGAGPLDILKLCPEVEVNGVDVNRAANNCKKYHRLRDELWGDLGDWLKGGGAIVDDETLFGELVSVEYSFVRGNIIKVEDKDSMKRRLKRSPDYADALALAVHKPLPRNTDYRIATTGSARSYLSDRYDTNGGRRTT